MKAQVNHTAPINTGPHFSKALPSETDYESLSPYSAFRPHDAIQNALQQSPICITLYNVISKIVFKYLT
jgi:hypothetical protein